MKQKNIWKILVSVLCICSLLGAGFVNISPFISQASGTTVTPESLGYTRITLQDFGIDDNTYSSNVNGQYTKASSLDGKYLDVDITTDAVVGTQSTRMNYAGGGAGGYWWGLKVVVMDGYLYFAMAANEGTAGTKAIDLKAINIANTDTFNLKLATNVVGADLQVDVWLEDAYQERMTFTNCASEVGTALGIFASNPAMKVETPEVGGEPGPTLEQKTPEELGYTRITLGDFGIEDDTYTATVNGSFSKGDSLNGKYLDVDITTGAVDGTQSTRINYAGGGAGGYWWGLKVVMLSDALYFVMSANEGTAGTGVIDLEPLEMTPTDTFNLKLAANVVGSDLQVDVWIDNVRQERMIFTGCASEVGTALGIFASTPSVTVATPGGSTMPEGPEQELEPVEQKTPEEVGYGRVTAEEFGIADDTYAAGSSMVYGNYIKGDSLAGKYLDVDVATDASTGNAYINYGGNIAGGWYGLRFTMLSDKMQFSMCLNEGSVTPFVFALDEVGLTAPTDTFNLKMAVSVEEADVVADVWIKDVRLGRMRFAGCAGEIGDWLGVYANEQAITIKTPVIGGGVSDIPEKIDTSFREITFGNFELADGLYEYKEGNYVYKDGQFGMNLHQTVFNGNIAFTEQGQFRYGGLKNGWEGLQFSYENGNLYMKDAYDHTELYVFLAKTAGVQFDEIFNLKISVEVIDYAGDGNMNDVKLGVWFNNKLYKNQYIYLTDYYQYMGRYIGIYSATGSLNVQSAEGVDTDVDFSIFGCSKEWKKDLGLK